MSTHYLHRPKLSKTAVNQVVSKTRIVLPQAKLPESFWKVAADYVVYYLNRTLKSNQTKTPWERLSGEIPDASLW